jgi:glycosyltransferase involved in cell wall biosynthesis
MNATTNSVLDSLDAAGVARRSGGAGVAQVERAPLISIVTVVMNAAHVFRDALNSIQRQKDSNLEYIVVDGGSTDGTLELIREFDHSISCWISETDRGIYDAMNKALTLAQGDWILFLGADDQLVAPLASIALKLKEKNSVYYGNVEIIETGKVYGGRFTRYQLMQRNICHQGIFYPRSVYKKKSYEINVGMQADYLYNIELWGDQVPFRYLGMVVSKFSIRGLSSGTSAAFEETKLAAVRANFGRHYYVAKVVRNIAVRTIKRLLGRS